MIQRNRHIYYLSILIELQRFAAGARVNIGIGQRYRTPTTQNGYEFLKLLAGNLDGFYGGNNIPQRFFGAMKLSISNRIKRLEPFVEFLLSFRCGSVELIDAVFCTSLLQSPLLLLHRGAGSQKKTEK